MSLKITDIPLALRDLRGAQLLTQTQLARRAGVSLRTIVNIERKHHQPRMRTRRNLLRALGVSFELHTKVFGKLPGRRLGTRL